MNSTTPATPTARRRSRFSWSEDYSSPPDVLSPAEKKESARYALPWLVFLLLPLGTCVLGDQASVGWRVTGTIATLLFATAYTWMILHPRPLASVPRVVTTSGYTVVLSLLTLLAFPASDITGVSFYPFLSALWLFTHRLIPTGLLGSLATISAHMVILWLGNPPTGFVVSALTTALSTLLFLAFVRFMMEIYERDRVQSEEVSLASQREELARTVHDVLGQSLTAITVKGQVAQKLLASDKTEPAARELDEILALARNALSDVRTAVTTLEKPELTEQLSTARTSLQAANISASLPTHSEVTSMPGLSATAKELYAWTVREAVTNIIRHAQASQVTIRISPTVLTITDNGVGMEATTAPSGSTGYGLSGLRRRIDAAGGTLSINSSEAGTTLEVTLDR